MDDSTSTPSAMDNAYISAIKRLGDQELSSLIDVLYQLKDKYEKKIDLIMNKL